MSDELVGEGNIYDVYMYICCIISYKIMASLRQKNPVISDDFVISLEPDT